MASFLHVLGDIGKISLKVLPFLPIPGTIGAVATTIAHAVDQELTGKSGPEKKAAAMAGITGSLELGGTPTAGKIASIEKLLEGVVAVLNALNELFGQPSAVVPNV